MQDDQKSESAVLTQSYWPADTSVALRQQTIGDLLRAAAAAHPERVALVDGQADAAQRRSWTYAELLTEAEAAALALLQRFGPGDRVAIWSPNRPEWVVLQQALSLAGLVMVALNPSYRSRELGYALGQSRAKGLVFADSYRGFDMATLAAEMAPDLSELSELISFSDWDALVAEGRSLGDAEALPAVAPLDPVQIQYTSGTTGFPKGALLHHLGVVNASAMAGHRARIVDGSVFVNAMPMYHIGGGSVTELGTMAAMGTYVLMPDFDPGLLLELIETYGGTHTLVVPTMLLATLDHPNRPSTDLSSLRVVMSGASTVPAALVNRTKETFGCDLVISFGQTELHGIITQTEVTDSAEDDDRILRAPRRDRRHHRRRRLAAHRRPRVDRRAWVRAHHRPIEGHDHPGWIEHLPARNRRSALRPSGGRRRCRRRCRRRPVGRARRGRPSTGRSGQPTRPGRAGRVLQRTDRSVQGAGLVVFGFGVPADALSSGKVQKFVLRDQLAAGQLEALEENGS